MENNQLADIIKKAGIPLFRNRYSAPLNRARDCLAGLTHYVDEGTMRYFRSRVSSSGVSCSGLLFYIVESCSLDPDHKTRGFRGVVFDVFGETVYRPDLDHCRKTSEAARRDMYAFINGFDLGAHYANTLFCRATRLEREAGEMMNTAKTIIQGDQI
jgi:hypothetical protein